MILGPLWYLSFRVMQVHLDQRESKAQLDRLCVNSLILKIRFSCKMFPRAFLPPAQGHTGLPGASGLKGLVGPKVIILFF